MPLNPLSGTANLIQSRDPKASPQTENHPGHPHETAEWDCPAPPLGRNIRPSTNQQCLSAEDRERKNMPAWQAHRPPGGCEHPPRALTRTPAFPITALSPCEPQHRRGAWSKGRPTWQAGLSACASVGPKERLGGAGRGLAAQCLTPGFGGDRVESVNGGARPGLLVPSEGAGQGPDAGLTGACLQLYAQACRSWAWPSASHPRPAQQGGPSCRTPLGS